MRATPAGSSTSPRCRIFRSQCATPLTDEARLVHRSVDEVEGGADDRVGIDVLVPVDGVEVTGLSELADAEMG